MQQATRGTYKRKQPELYSPGHQSDGLGSSSKSAVQWKPIKRTIEKSVQLNIIGLDCGAIDLGGVFSSNARRQGWSEEEILAVLRDAGSGSYHRVVSVLALHCE
ncbi:MAG: hypothetical protein JWR22_2826 [Herminiimonas sp.]|nr:hypothetical protein [Herminiimonas sp.]